MNYIVMVAWYTKDGHYYDCECLEDRFPFVDAEIYYKHNKYHSSYFDDNYYRGVIRVEDCNYNVVSEYEFTKPE